MVFRRDPTVFTRYGGWIPSNERIYRGFHSRVALAARRHRTALSNHEPAVQAFADAIDKKEPGQEKSLMRTLFDRIFLQMADEYNFVDASFRQSHVAFNTNVLLRLKISTNCSTRSTILSSRHLSSRSS